MPPAEDSKVRLKSWQVPDYLTARSEEVCTWAKQQVDDGRTYFEAQPGYEQLEEAVRMLSGEPDPKLAVKQRDGKYSKLRTSRLKRNLREMIGALAEIHFVPGYRSDNSDIEKQATTLNKYSAFWYNDRKISRSIKRALQWMAITPCAWIEIVYHRLPGDRDKCYIDLLDHSAFDVVMTGVPENNDFQQAYTVTIIKDLPMHLAHSTWPDSQEDLRPDSETPKSWFDKIRDKVRTIASDIFTIPSSQPATAKNPTCRLYYQYVLDLAINTTGKEIKMGYVKESKTEPITEIINGVPVTRQITREVEIETPWSYKVPSVGSPIPAGYDRDGQPVTRMAEKKDCRLFPGRRLIVFTESKKKVYDGPMFDWVGKVPLVKLCGDPWPFGDFSLTFDPSPIQSTIGELERMAHQTARNRYNPSLLYNYRAVDRNKAKVFRTDVTGQRLGYNGAEGTGDNVMRPALPKEFYGVEDWYMKFMQEYLGAAMDHQMGVRDIAALSKLKLGANQDQIEKALEIAGPIVKSISQDMEFAMRDLAEMLPYYVLQYVRTPALLTIVGVDGIKAESYDFRPGKLIPSHLPGESKSRPSAFSEMQRAHWVADQIKFFIAPNTLHEIVQTSQKLIYLQLWRSPQPFPIDPWTIAEVLRIGNFGSMPEGENGKDMLSRWMYWQETQLRFKMKMAAEAKILARELGLDEEGMDGGGGGGTPKGGARGRGGRAPSGQAAPQLANKDGGARQTIKESR